MSPLIHFLASLLIAIFLFPIDGWNVLLIFVGGVLIDIDHLFWYIIKFKEFNLLKMYKWCRGLRDIAMFKNLLFIFHTAEFFILIAILSFFSEELFMVFIGLLVHYMLDVVYIRRTFGRFMFLNPFCLWYKRRNS